MDESSSKEIDLTRLLLDELEAAGYRAQEHGRSLVQLAGRGRAALDFLKDEMPKYEKIAAESPEVADALSRAPSWLRLARSQIDESVGRVRASEHGFGEALSYAVTGVTSTNTLSSSFASAIGLTEVTNPKIKNIHERYNLKDFSIVRGSDDAAELGELLAQVDSRLDKRRLGAWQTLVSGSADSLPQAAHSMRDVLSALISKYASNDNLKVCRRWAPAPDTKDGVSLAQRLRLLLYGASGGPTSDEVAVVEAEIERFDRAYAYLKQVAHGSGGATKQLVEVQMRTLERLMLILLNRRRQEFRDDVSSRGHR